MVAYAEVAYYAAVSQQPTAMEASPMMLAPHSRQGFECVALPLPPNIGMFREDGSLKSLEEIEADAIRFHIEHHRGQMSSVARSLRIGRSTLYRKLDLLEGSEPPRTYIG